MIYEQDIADREVIAKLWGFEEVLVNNDKYCSKILWISPGFKCSLHYHKIKDETFVAIDGTVWVEYFVDRVRHQTILLGWRRESLHLPPGTPHRFWALGDGAALLEISTPHSDEDVVRLEPSAAMTPDEDDALGWDEDQDDGA